MKRNLKVVLGLAVVLFTLLVTFQVFALTSVTNAQMLDMSSRADAFIDTYGVVPQIIYTDTAHTDSVTAAEFYYMMSRWLRYYRANGAPPSTVGITRGTGGPPSPSGSESGTIYQADMLTRSKDNADFIDSNGRLPNYTVFSPNNITPEAFFRCLTRTINFYQDNGRLPNYTVISATDAPDSWTGGGAAPTTTPPPSYPWSRTLSVPYTAQPDSYTCGPTSLRMVMQYNGVTKTVSEISSYMASIGDSPYNDGVAEDTICSAASHYGFSGRSIQSGATALKNAIAAGKPVIAHLQITAGGNPRYYPSGSAVYSSYTGGHYIVVCGLQADGSGNVLYVVVNDPSKGSNLKYTWSSFDSAWASKSRHFIQLN